MPAAAKASAKSAGDNDPMMLAPINPSNIRWRMRLPRISQALVRATWLGGGDGMEERAADIAAAAAGWSERAALPVGQLGKGRIAVRGEARVVKFMPAHAAPCTAKRAVAKKPRLAIAEVQLALGKARRVAEETGHGVAMTARILHAFAEHHVTPAFAVHRPRLRKAREPGAKSARPGQGGGGQLGVGARGPGAIGVIGRRLVSEGREGHDLRPRAPPSLDDVRIDECKSRVAGQRDALAG